MMGQVPAAIEGLPLLGDVIENIVYDIGIRNDVKDGSISDRPPLDILQDLDMSLARLRLAIGGFDREKAEVWAINVASKALLICHQIRSVNTNEEEDPSS